MPRYFIGLMSGTSFDGVDAVIVDFSVSPPKLIASAFEPYPTTLVQTLRALVKSPQISLLELGQLDKRLANIYTDTVNQLLENSHLNRAQIAAIGCHGQTIFHAPPSNSSDTEAFTLQIGDPSTLAVNTGIDVVADFRQADVALGGQGAPLAPAFHHYMLHQHAPIAILNLGGIANITLINPHSSEVIAYDTGPASTLLDAWINHCCGHNYDDQGQWAASGTVHEGLLNILLAHPFFALAAPKSTGFETFNITWLQACIAKIEGTISNHDIQATLLALTVQTIADQLTTYNGKQLIICGGGAHNRFLMQQLQAVTGLTLSLSDTWGIETDWMEAMAFAWLAKQRLDQQCGNLCSVTGARSETILGGLYCAPK